MGQESHFLDIVKARRCWEESFPGKEGMYVFANEDRVVLVIGLDVWTGPEWLGMGWSYLSELADAR
jgi:hypothetical protein